MFDLWVYGDQCSTRISLHTASYPLGEQVRKLHMELREHALWVVERSALSKQLFLSLRIMSRVTTQNGFCRSSFSISCPPQECLSSAGFATPMSAYAGEVKPLHSACSVLYGNDTCCVSAVILTGSPRRTRCKVVYMVAMVLV